MAAEEPPPPPAPPPPVSLVARHIVVVLGVQKPSENPDFEFEGGTLQKRADAGIRAFLTLAQQQRGATLLLSGGFDEAATMARYARERFEEAGLASHQAARALLVEGTSRTTVENALCCREQLLDGVPLREVSDLVVWLVAGLTHLPRSLMLFKAALPLATVVGLPAHGGALDQPAMKNHGPDCIRRDAKSLEARVRGCVQEARIQQAVDLARRLLPRSPKSAWFTLETAWGGKAGWGVYLEGAAVPLLREGHSDGAALPVRCGPLGGGQKKPWWVLLPSPDEGWSWLVNVWWPHLRVHTEFGAVLATEHVPEHWSSAKWRVEEAANGTVRLVNKWAMGGKVGARALHMEHADQPTHACYGLAEWGKAPAHWRSAKWRCVAYPSVP